LTAPPERPCSNKQYSAITHSLDHLPQGLKRAELAVVAQALVGGIETNIFCTLLRNFQNVVVLVWNLLICWLNFYNFISHGPTPRRYTKVMAVLKEVEPDSEAEATSKKKASAGKNSDAMDVDNASEESGEGEEEEYEIEAILNAQRGAFPNVLSFVSYRQSALRTEDSSMDIRVERDTS